MLHRARPGGLRGAAALSRHRSEAAATRIDNPRMNPLLARLHPYPFERLRELTRDITPQPRLPPDQPGHRRAASTPTPDVHQARADAARSTGLASYPATAGEPRAARGDAPAGWSGATACALDPATQVLPVNGSREALFALAQTVIDPTQPTAPPWSARIRSIRSTKARPCSPARSTAFANSDPARNFAADWSQHRRRHLGAHAAALRLLARQPDRRGDAAGRMAAAVRAVRPPRLRDRLATSAIRRSTSATRRRSAALRSGHARSAATDFRNLVAFTSLSKRSNVPGMRSGFVAGDAGILKRVPALPHLPRQRDEPGGAAGQHRGLERRGARGRQPRAVPREVRAGHAAARRGARRRAARRRLLPVGRRVRMRMATTSSSPAACSLNTM